MQAKVTGTRHELILEGPISEKTTIFEHPVKTATEIVLDMEKVTFINSIGVKNWINWSLNLPLTCKVSILKCPYVIVNQVNIVEGFLPRNGKIESFVAPYLCEECSFETNVMAIRGKDYDYATETSEKYIKLALEMPCPKCRAKMEPDFVVEKAFSFLDLKR